MGDLLQRRTPKGLVRWAARFPIGLYRVRLGWLLGDRFLLLEHVGRKTGLPRRTVLEVVDHDPERGTYFVASGWGTKSQWFQNITAEPDVKVTVGLRTHPARALPLTEGDAANTLYRYATRHPGAFRKLTRFMLGRPLEPQQSSCVTLAQAVPIVALVPVPEHLESQR